MGWSVGGQSPWFGEDQIHNLAVLDAQPSEDKIHNLAVLIHNLAVLAAQTSEDKIHNLAVLEAETSADQIHNLAVLEAQTSADQIHNLAMLGAGTMADQVHNLAVLDAQTMEDQIHNLEQIHNLAVLDAQASEFKLTSCSLLPNSSSHSLFIATERPGLLCGKLLGKSPTSQNLNLRQPRRQQRCVYIPQMPRLPWKAPREKAVPLPSATWKRFKKLDVVNPPAQCW